MKDILIIAACLYALAVVWQPAAAALSTVADVPLLIRSSLLGTVGGALFGLFIAYTWIYNGLIEADRRRAHEKVDADQDKRRI